MFACCLPLLGSENQDSTWMSDVLTPIQASSHPASAIESSSLHIHLSRSDEPETTCMPAIAHMADMFASSAGGWQCPRMCLLVAICILKTMYMHTN